jgi:predicted enzyme related to lactoylglutathione lyase
MAGDPIWYELMVTDPVAVAPFYRAVIGWEIATEAGQSGTGSEYRMIQRADGGFVGGALTIKPEMRDKAPPKWLTYFDVDDVEAKVAQAKALGAQVWMPPTRIPQGTIALLSDPQGAPFYLMDPIPPEGQPDAKSDVFQSKAPGHCWWNELETTDEPGATAFYKALFGWNTDQAMPMGDKGDYRFVAQNGEQIGAINPWMADYMTVGWLPYFGVADIDAAKAAAEANGGTINHDVHQVPGGDFIFVATDPAGVPVGFVGPKGA